MLVEFEAPGQLARVEGQLSQRHLIGTPGFDRAGHRRALALQPPEGIEQLSLPALVQQPLLVVLPVYLNKAARHVGKPSRRDRLVVDPRSRSAGARHLAHADQRLR